MAQKQRLLGPMAEGSFPLRGTQYFLVTFVAVPDGGRPPEAFSRKVHKWYSPSYSTKTVCSKQEGQG